MLSQRPYRRDGATKPLFRSRVSMLSSTVRPCPVAERNDNSSESSISPTVTKNFATRMSTYGNGLTTSRPRPRMWSGNPTTSKRSYAETGYDSESESDSDSDEEEMFNQSSAIRGHSRHRRKRGRTSPTSCTTFPHDLPKRSQSSSSSGEHKNTSVVTFPRNPVAEVRYRPRTPVDQKRTLFYSKADIGAFRRAYHEWMDRGYDPDELLDSSSSSEEEVEDLSDDESFGTAAKIEAQQHQAHQETRTTAEQEKEEVGCVTPDVSSEEEEESDDNDQ